MYLRSAKWGQEIRPGMDSRFLDLMEINRVPTFLDLVFHVFRDLLDVGCIKKIAGDNDVQDIEIT